MSAEETSPTLKRFLDKDAHAVYDLLLIGGGITGAALAYDAASRGLKVALVEKGDFGGATSAATSKIIHGGLRYLKTFEFSLVRESLRERRILENIAPNFVYPMPFMFVNPALELRPALWIYDLLSYDKGRTWDKSKKIPWHGSVSREAVLKEEPNVRRDNLRNALIYYDCLSICPERLTLAFIKSAVRHGARVANYARADGFVFSGKNHISGVRVTDLINNREREVAARVTVNCSGPWADFVLQKAGRASVGKVVRSEGIHLITKKLINTHVVCKVKKGRHFFLIPWRNRSLIGTTDTPYHGHPDDYRVTRQSIDGLLDFVNQYFGNDNPIRYEDVLFAYGGLRPLVGSRAENVYQATRKYEIFDHAAEGLEGLMTVEGGKYTTSRSLAEKVVKDVCRKLGRPYGKTMTHKNYLAGCDIPDINRFMEKIGEENTDINPATIRWLGTHYGTDYQKVLDLARGNPELAEPLDPDGEILAQVVYAVREEMAYTLNDLIFRRTGIGTLGHPGWGVLQKVADLAGGELGWDAARLQKELDRAAAALRVPE